MSFTYPGLGRSTVFDNCLVRSSLFYIRPRAGPGIPAWGPRDASMSMGPMWAVHGGDSINAFGFLILVCRFNSWAVGLSVKFQPVRMSTFRGQVPVRWKAAGDEKVRRPSLECSLGHKAFPGHQGKSVGAGILTPLPAQPRATDNVALALFCLNTGHRRGGEKTSMKSSPPGSGTKRVLRVSSD